MLAVKVKSKYTEQLKVRKLQFISFYRIVRELYDSQTVFVGMVFNNTALKDKQMIENHVVFLNNDVVTVEPSQTEDLDLDLGRHPDQYSLCSSSCSSQADEFLSECYSNGGEGLAFPDSTR